MIALAPIRWVERRNVGHVARLLPRTFLLAGAFVAISDAFAFGKASFASLAQLLPFDVPSADPLAAILSAVGLTALAIGLYRGKRLAWWLAILVFAAGVPVQMLALGHTAGGVVAAIALALLTLDNRYYGVRSARTWSWTAWALLGVGAATATLETVLIVLHEATHNFPAELPDFAGAISSWLAFGDLREAPRGPHTELILALAIASRVALIVALLAMLRPAGDDVPTPELRSRVLDLAKRYGRGALLPFQLTADKRWFCPVGRQGFVAYGRDGRTAVAVGDPVGPADERWATFAAFVDACRQHDWVPVVYQASSESLERLDALGFQASPIGREAVIDLAGFGLSGSRRANLRHTIARAKRGGLTVAWFPEGIGTESEGLGDRLVAIDARWRAGAGPAEMEFTISRFSALELQRIPVAVALDPGGDPTAFVSFRPTGSDGGFVLDLIRRLPDGVPGAVEFCLAEAAERFRDAGATTLSLGLAPLSGLDPSGERLEERALAAIARLVRPFYDVAGLAFFKDKFAPRWETRYVAVPSRAALLGLGVALTRLHLGSLSRTAARSVSRGATAGARMVARANARASRS